MIEILKLVALGAVLEGGPAIAFDLPDNLKKFMFACDGLVVLCLF